MEPYRKEQIISVKASAKTPSSDPKEGWGKRERESVLPREINLNQSKGSWVHVVCLFSSSLWWPVFLWPPLVWGYL